MPRLLAEFGNDYPHQWRHAVALMMLANKTDHPPLVLIKLKPIQTCQMLGHCF